MLHKLYRVSWPYIFMWTRFFFLEKKKKNCKSTQYYYDITWRIFNLTNHKWLNYISWVHYLMASLFHYESMSVWVTWHLKCLLNCGLFSLFLIVLYIYHRSWVLVQFSWIQVHSILVFRFQIALHFYIKISWVLVQHVHWEDHCAKLQIN